MAERILVNFPTNFGDMIMALPAFDRICAARFKGRFTVIASPATKDFFLGHAFIDEVILFDKKISLLQKMRFCASLRGKYDMMIDFKHSLLPVLLNIKKHTALRRSFPEGLHARKEYLSLVEPFISGISDCPVSEFILPEEKKARWDELRLGGAVCVATSSNSDLKQYPLPLLRTVVENLAREQKVVLLGDLKARTYYQEISSLPGVTDLSGKTSFLDVWYILSRYASVCLSVDSSLMHLSSYLDVPVCALFGPTGVDRYGPWSERSLVLTRKELPCRPCRKPVCPFNRECMNIDPERILSGIKALSAYENP